jgi:hypothetical protein
MSVTDKREVLQERGAIAVWMYEPSPRRRLIGETCGVPVEAALRDEQDAGTPDIRRFAGRHRAQLSGEQRIRVQIRVVRSVVCRSPRPEFRGNGHEILAGQIAILPTWQLRHEIRSAPLARRTVIFLILSSPRSSAMKNHVPEVRVNKGTARPMFRDWQDAG